MLDNLGIDLKHGKKGEKMGKYIHAGVGISNADDASQAGKEAVEMALENMRKDGGKKPDFALVFCSGGKYGKNEKTMKKFVDAVHGALTSANKNVKWIGCTTAGEISNYGISFGSVVVSVIESDYIRWGVGYAEGAKEKPFEAGKQAAEKALNDLKVDKYLDAYISFQLVRKKQPGDIVKNRQFLVITINPGFTLKESGWEEQILEGIKEAVGPYTPIVGASAMDDLRFLDNFQFVNGVLSRDICICTALYSNLKLGFGIAHGFKPTNKIGMITDAEGTLLKKINDRPALDVYAEFVGVDKEYIIEGFKSLKRIKAIPSTFMTIAAKVNLTEALMRRFKFLEMLAKNPLGVPDIHRIYWLKILNNCRENGELVMNSRVEKNLPVILMKPDKKETLSATLNSIEVSCKEMNFPKFVLVFECAGRLLLIGRENITECYELITKKKKYKNTLYTGFYSGAEIGLTKKMSSEVHSYTCTSFAIEDELIVK